MADWLKAHSRCRYSFSTSAAIAPYVAGQIGITTAEAFARRHEDRELWRRVGDALRADDPAFLARKTLAGGDLSVGIRARVEIEAVQRERLVDLTLWVDRAVPPDPTLEFGPEMADVVIQNHWGLSELYARLAKFANALGILRC